MVNVALIGYGGIGYRHLQGLSQTDVKVDIFVIDPDQEALALGENRLAEMSANKQLKSILFANSLSAINKDIDLAIISTNANNRKNIVEQLLNKVKVKFLILEKVAFQSVGDFTNSLSLIRKKGVRAWVNCPNRAFACYKDLKKINFPNGRVSMHVDGGNWNLASNCIHYIDLFSYLAMETIISIDSSGLDKRLYSSKRNDFIELGGYLCAKTNNGDNLTLVDDKNSDRPVVISIANENFKCIVFESRGEAIIQYKETNWEWEKLDFAIPHQSELTKDIVEQILITEKSDLTSIDESFLLHKPMLESFNQHLTTVTGCDYYKCPIT